VSERLAFSDGDTSLEVDLARGGRITQLSFGGHDLLVAEENDPLRWGSYPMVPFAGRVRHGRFSFRVAEHALPTNLAPHAAHGYGFVGEWRRVDEATIEYAFAPPWPFVGAARQSFDVSEGRVTCTLEVRAAEEQPVMLGWHPWFRRELDDGSQLELDVEPSQMYELDSEMIPTGRLVAPPARPWDNCFVGLERPPRLRWGSTLALEVTSSCDHWVIYDEPEHAICVEPQSGAPDEFNREPLVLVASDRIVHSMTIQRLPRPTG